MKAVRHAVDAESPSFSEPGVVGSLHEIKETLMAHSGHLLTLQEALTEKGGSPGGTEKLAAGLEELGVRVEQMGRDLSRMLRLIEGAGGMA